MSHETTGQPLKDQPPRDPRDQHLVKGVLGGRAASEMDELVDDRPKKPTQTPTELQMSASEAAAVNPEKRLRYDRFKEFSKWIDLRETPFTHPENFFKARKFVFNPDGTVDVLGDLNLMSRPYTHLPEGFNHVAGSFLIGGTFISDLSSLPRIIDGNLNLQGIKATTIPEGIEVGGEVYISAIQTELLKDAEDKGYRVLKM